MEIRILNPTWNGPEVRLEPGDELLFGRDQGGAGRIGSDLTRAVSRHHGTVRATDDGFTVRATGSHVGVVVRDRSTPSELHVPSGVGPITVPFRSCSIVLDENMPIARLDLEVTGSPPADRWHERWGVEVEELLPSEPLPGLMTLAPFPADRFYRNEANTKRYAWWVTLLALCEPLFGVGPAGIPTNLQLSARLNYSTKTIEQHLTKIYEVLRVDAALRQREIAAHVAIRRGIVVEADLEGLSSVGEPQRSASRPYN